MRTVLLLIAFGSAGTLARYWLQGWVQFRSGAGFPTGTLAVNLLGCFLLGFSGATVLRGVGGYGSTSIYHTDKILRLSQDLPIIIEVVEYSERIEAILPRLDEMVDGGLITLEKVRVILYRSRK